MFNLQRHSDHHYRPNRRYQILRAFPESPQLPNGYAGMVFLTLLSPLWQRPVDRAPGGFPGSQEDQSRARGGCLKDSAGSGCLVCSGQEAGGAARELLDRSTDPP